MTTNILEALIQLFALFAAGHDKKGVELGRSHAARYMRAQLPKAWAEESLMRFDELVDQFQRLSGSGEELRAKRLSKLSVKLLRTCTQINKGLEWHEKHVVVLRLMEFLGQVPDEEKVGQTFMATVCESFAMTQARMDALQALVSNEGANSEQVGNDIFELDGDFLGGRFGGSVKGLHLMEGNLFLLKTNGEGSIRVNHNEMPRDTVALLAPGGALRDCLGSTLFHSELVAHLAQTTQVREPLSLRTVDVSHYFKFPTNQALHQFSFEANGGQLVGVMGGSGSGKSTLLNILNGSIKPSFGRVTINGHDIHNDASGVAGMIGHVPQDDVLIAELTVRENLAFNANLSLGTLPMDEQIQRVDQVLAQLGLLEIQHLRVGSVMDKVISGGQRKRLNIGLELLRNPPVLFLDEPTSGLSSRDSEQVMDLLKELTYAGQLVFAVLHQPSSDLFKMLDRLFMLDAGGHPIYWGYPLEAIRHFNALSSRVHADQVECSNCGNVNPEQLFDIVEARTVDEYGKKTGARQTTPKEWNDFYTIILGNNPLPEERKHKPLPSTTSVANGWQQWRTYLRRDVLTKWRSKQYLWVNGLEAPALAMVLAMFMRFSQPGMEYNFRASENIPPFLFISVIVALFLGLSVSAEEVLRDRKQLNREAFLHVKWRHYIHAKMTVVASVTLFHAIGFVAVSHVILEMPAFAWKHVMVLFAVGLFGSMLGLFISSIFKSAKVVYILIPLLVIPQIILGGAIVRFDRFNPALSKADGVPWFGNVIASRWGFEALAVELARNNPFDAAFVPWEDRLYQAAWRRDYWLSEMKRSGNQDAVMAELRKSEQELSEWEGSPFSWEWDSANTVDWKVVQERYGRHYASAFAERRALRKSIQTTSDLADLKDASHNDRLWSWVLQDDRSQRAMWINDEIKQVAGPIHRPMSNDSGLHEAMYVPYKRVGNMALSTFLFDTLVLLFMTAGIWVALLLAPHAVKLQLGSVNAQRTSPQV